MPYKDPERRRTITRESVRRYRARRAAAADRLEAPPPGEEPCRRCRKRRRTIRYGGIKGSLVYCRSCAGEILMLMVTHLCGTTEPEATERCRLCRREPVNSATVPVYHHEDRPELCRLCAAHFANNLLDGLVPATPQGLHHAA